MLGAIAGDMIGSIYEHNPIKHKNFKPVPRHFTDDTVLTLAVAQAILENSDMADTIKDFARRYPDSGYGGFFRKWMWTRKNQPYNSFGNGSAMRVSPVGFAYDSMDKVLKHAKQSAEATHNHPEGVKGAQATAVSILMGRQGADKQEIRTEIANRFGYDLNRTVDQIRPGYRFDVTCQGSVPESIIAFLDADSWQDAVQNAISLGGDVDTMACIAGGIAQAFYGKIPGWIAAQARMNLPLDLRDVLDRFNDEFQCPH